MMGSLFHFVESPSVGGDADHQHQNDRGYDPTQPPAQHRPAEHRQSGDHAEQRRPSFRDYDLAQNRRGDTGHRAVAPASVAVPLEPPQQEYQQEWQIIFPQLRARIEWLTGPAEPVIR